MIIISPSKNLQVNDEVLKFEKTSPFFLSETNQLVKKFKNLDIREIKSLMKISDSLATLNHERFKNINKKNNTKKPAVFLFSGDTFNGLSIRLLDDKSLGFAQKNLRILSGLYGVLRPFDLIEPYRLEMGTKTDEIIGKNLYNFWGEKLTNRLNNEIIENGDGFLFNLSSNEYFSVLNASKLKCKIVNFDFKKIKNNKLTSIGMMIKKLRGAMAKYIIQNKINSFEKIKEFNDLGFQFSEFNNSTNNFLFTSR